MELQILDCDYIMLNNKPIIRIFGKTIDGETICVFFDKFLPYFYLYVDQDKIDDIKFELEKNDELKIEVVERYLPIGYQAKPVKVFKIIGKDPSKTPQIREYVKKFGTPYEADILFKYRFMTDNDLKGMGWIDVKGIFRNTNTVKCKALDAESIKPIEILKNAPLKFISIDIECLTGGNNLPNSEKDPIIMIALSFSPDYKGKKSLVLVARQCNLEDTLSFADEKELLENFKVIIDDYDPDIITGYNIENFDIPFILHRLRVFKLSGDIGRSEKIAFTKKLTYSQRTTICGRVILDPYFIIRYLSVYDQPYKFKRYDLDTVAKEMLGSGKHKMGGMREVISLWNGSKDNLKRLVDYCRKDADLALELLTSHKLIDINKFIEMSKLSGLLLQDLMAGQAARHESALLREFYKRKYLIPCKPGREDIHKRSTKELKGALVLEPDAGLHKDGCTIVLDFTALYPSLICAHNICPTTLIDKPNNLKYETSPTGSSFVTKDVREGVFPYIAKYLLDTRAEIKKKMKDEQNPSVRKILDAKQYALKGMAVSLYGYTAFIGGRLFTPQVAAAITSWGRQNIEFTKDLIEKNFPVKVIYGDTDSIFVKTKLTDLDSAHELGIEISKFVTQKLTGLELKLDKIFKTFLIETKKRYAGWSFEKENGSWVDKIEMKGIETVRRDWCLGKDTLIQLWDGTIKKISELDEGSSLMSLDLDNLKISEDKCIRKIRSFKPVKNIVTQYSDIKASDDHRFFVYERGKIKLKHVKELKIGDYLIISSKIPFIGSTQKLGFQIFTLNRKKINIPTETSRELCQIIGFVFGDGTIVNKKVVLYNKNLTLLNYYNRLFKKVFKLDGKLYLRKDAHRLVFFSKTLEEFFRFIRIKDKSDIPQFIHKVPIDQLVSFLRGYFDADGYYSTPETATVQRKSYITVGLSCKTRHVLDQIKLLLQRFGILSSNTTLNDRGIDKAYTISMYGEHARRFLNKIGFSIMPENLYKPQIIKSDKLPLITEAKKLIKFYGYRETLFIRDKKQKLITRANLERILKFVESRAKLNTDGGSYPLIEKIKKILGSDITFAKITSIEDAGISETYDIDTVLTDAFLANGILSHNCQLTSETMLEVLNIILKEGDVKKASKHVRNVIDDLAKGKIPIEKLSIIKGITKALADYDGIQPHIELAKKIAKRDFTRGPLVGERLEYVIIRGNQLLSKRAEDPNFVKEKRLEIDSEYYIYNQVLPPLERIFEVCGVSSSELLEGVKQKSLLDILNGQKKQLSPDETVLKTFEAVICKNCDWSFRRPPLTGNCPKCSSPLYFSASGSIGKTVDLT